MLKSEIKKRLDLSSLKSRAERQPSELLLEEHAPLCSCLLVFTVPVLQVTDSKTKCMEGLLIPLAPANKEVTCVTNAGFYQGEGKLPALIKISFRREKSDFSAAPLLSLPFPFSS